MWRRSVGVAAGAGVAVAAERGAGEGRTRGCVGRLLGGDGGERRRRRCLGRPARGRGRGRAPRRWEGGREAGIKAAAEGMAGGGRSGGGGGREAGITAAAAVGSSQSQGLAVSIWFLFSLTLFRPGGAVVTAGRIRLRRRPGRRRRPGYFFAFFTKWGKLC